MDDQGSEQSDHSSGQEDEEMNDISRPEVVTKYKTAADIVNAALSRVIAACAPGKNVLEICTLGDATITEATSKVYNKKSGEEEMIKGIAFPTCLSINQCACHFCPAPPDDTVLRAGDMVKIDLGAHIDGYIAVAAHTVIVGEPAPSGRKADALMAAWKAAECIGKMLKPGVKNYDLTEAILRIASTYHVQPLEAVLSHQMKRYIIDANKVIMNRPAVDQHVEEAVVEANEVWSLDIVMSTGEGKAREGAQRPNVFKRAVDQSYTLRMKSARTVFSEVSQKFASLPFSIRQLEAGPTAGRLGLTEILAHNMLHVYPVLFERDGEFIAQFKATFLVMSNATHKITAQDIPLQTGVMTPHAITDPAILRVLATSLGKKKKKKSKKGGEAKAETEEEEEEKKEETEKK